MGLVRILCNNLAHKLTRKMLKGSMTKNKKET